MDILQSLRLTSFNCHGFKSSSDFINSHLNDSDIVALQETWLLPNELNLTNINKNVNSFSISSVNLEDKILVGRPYGGLTFIWKNDLSKNVQIREYKDSRILGLSLSLEGKSILILNVYVPTNSPNYCEEFTIYMGKISAILSNCEEENVCVIGDMNASPGNSRFDEIKSLCRDHEMVIADVEILPQDSFSHLNHGSLTSSWIDHSLMSLRLLQSVVECKLIDDFSTSDHCPLTLNLAVNRLPTVLPFVLNQPTIKWRFNDKVKLEKFQNLLDRKIGQILRSPDWPNCVHERCFCLNHSEKLEKLYKKLNAEIIRCGEESFGRQRHRGKEVPGWNENVKQHYAQYREAYQNWRQMGSERQGDSGVHMRV